MGAIAGPGSVVTLEFTLWDSGGEALEWSDPGQPLVALLGRGALLPGLERALAGREAGAELALEIPPELAYGWRDESLVESVPRARFEGGPAPAVGERFAAASPSGRVRWALVVGFAGEDVLLDLNHPLAGQTLRVEARLVGVRAATPAELAAGRALAGL